MRIWLVLAGGCSGGACLELPATCTPQYEPTFEAVYANTVSGTCQLSGCHGDGSANGGLSMGSTADEAHAALSAVVDPEEPECSVLLDRLEPTGKGGMPPGNPLSDEERCAIREWIAGGAPGPVTP